MYNQAGDMLVNAGDIGEEIPRHWGPHFKERQTDAEAQEEFFRFAVEQHEVEEWHWPRGAWKEDLANVHDATPGPDGLSYAFWRDAPEEWSSLIDELSEHMAASRQAPRGALATRTVCIPTGRVSRRRPGSRAQGRGASAHHLHEHNDESVSSPGRPNSRPRGICYCCRAAARIHGGKGHRPEHP